MAINNRFRKYLPHIAKNDNVVSIKIDYVAIVNGDDTLIASTKIELADKLSTYRNSYNEIHSLCIYKVTYSELNEKLI